MVARWIGVVLALTSCDLVFELSPPVEESLDAGSGATTIDAPAVPFGVRFTMPMPVDLGGEADDPSLTNDLLELYFERDGEIMFATRTRPEDPFGAPILIDEVSTSSFEVRPCVSRDGLRLYLSRVDAGVRLFLSTRATRTALWSVPSPLDTLNTGLDQQCGWESPDQGTLLYQCTNVSPDICLAQRDNPAADPMSKGIVQLLSTAMHEGTPTSTDDGTDVLFESDRLGNIDIFEAFGGTIVHHAELGSGTGYDGAPWISADGRTLFFASRRNGSDEVFTATR
jgi:hypothetical protein